MRYFRRLSNLPVEGSVDGWTGNRKDLGQIADGIIAGVVHAAQLVLLFVRQLGLFSAQLPFGSRDGHALPRAHADQVGFELGEGGEDVEEHFAHGVGGIIDARSQSQPDATFDQSVGDGAGIGNRARQPVELRHDERVAGAGGSEGLIEAGPGAVVPVRP